MPVETILSHGVMEGNGAYNRNAAIPAHGGALALPFLAKAVHKVALDTGDRPIVIGDYGSSQGKNSLAPMQVSIRNFRQRIAPDREIFVFHIDQPSNDFNTLFEVLSSDPDRYAADDASVFPCAIGKSFYEQALPSNSLDLAWSSYAAVWLRSIPCLIPGHFIAALSTGAVRRAFAKQAAEDWEYFLTLRAREMRRGARLVVVLPAIQGVTSRFAVFMNQANAVLSDMVEDGSIRPEERSRMVLGTYPRTQEELLAPFNNKAQFAGLTLEDFDEAELADSAWADYQSDGDREALAKKKALFFRAVFVPSLASALDDVRAGDTEALRRFADRLEYGLTQRLAKEPISTEMLVQTIVLAKNSWRAISDPPLA